MKMKKIKFYNFHNNYSYFSTELLFMISEQKPFGSMIIGTSPELGKFYSCIYSELDL